MREMGLGRHLVVLAALLVNLWLGGALVHVWLGELARDAFELTLILAWLVLVVGLRLLPSAERRRNNEDARGRGD